METNTSIFESILRPLKANKDRTIKKLHPLLPNVMAIAQTQTNELKLFELTNLTLHDDITLTNWSLAHASEEIQIQWRYGSSNSYKGDILVSVGCGKSL